MMIQRSNIKTIKTKKFAKSQGYTVLRIPNASPAQISNIPQKLKETYCESNEAATLDFSNFIFNSFLFHNKFSFHAAIGRY